MEIGIDETVLQRLLQDQHPDLEGLSLARVAGGWDNQMWRLGGELALCIPRTPRADSLLRREQRWLPDLAPRLPLPVPAPVRVGEPSEHFPRLWTVVRWVAGAPADRAPIQDADHASAALAGFLRALHLEAPAQAPNSPGRGVPLSAITDEFHERLDAVVADVKTWTYYGADVSLDGMDPQLQLIWSAQGFGVLVPFRDGRRSSGRVSTIEYRELGPSERLRFVAEHGPRVLKGDPWRTGARWQLR